MGVTIKQHPVRLTNIRFLPASSSLCMYKQKVDRLFELHWHEFYELCFVMDGFGKNIVNGEVHHLTPGSLFLLTPADFHEIEPEPGHTITMYNLVFNEKWIDVELQRLLFFHEEKGSISADVGASHFDKVKLTMEWIYEEYTNKNVGCEIGIKGLLDQLLLELVRNQADGRMVQEFAARTGFASIQKPILYLRHHFREEIKLADAAKIAGLSRTYFSQIFRRHTGVPFQVYLQDLRLQFAKSLLTASTLSITEICHASGFNTLTHFERAFKIKYGVSPRIYRSNAK